MIYFGINKLYLAKGKTQKVWGWGEQNRHILKSDSIQVMKQTFLNPQRYEQTGGSGYRFGIIMNVKDILIRQDR